MTNEEQARHWNGDESAHWLVHEERYEPGVGDVAVSRFGVMFFADPAAAFANIARGLRSRGRLVFVCWQNLAGNEWIVVFGATAAQHMALPPLDDPIAPGTFSLGDRDRIAAVLRGAALTDVAIESVAEPLWMGADPPTVARGSEAVQAALEPYVTPDGVLLGSRARRVTASRPWQ